MPRPEQASNFKKAEVHHGHERHVTDMTDDVTEERTEVKVLIPPKA